MADLRFRFPIRQDILAVLAVIAVVVYSWTLYRLAFFVPGWFNAMTIGEILVVACYGFVVDLVESLVILALLLLLVFILPVRLFREKFTSQATFIVLALAIGTIYLQDNIAVFYDWQPDQFRFAILAALLIFALLFMISWMVCHHIGAADRLLRALAERATVFLFLYLPLSIASLIVVIVLNLQ